jgi:hypothetical protein
MEHWRWWETIIQIDKTVDNVQLPLKNFVYVQYRLALILSHGREAVPTIQIWSVLWSGVDELISPKYVGMIRSSQRYDQQLCCFAKENLILVFSFFSFLLFLVPSSKLKSIRRVSFHPNPCAGIGDITVNVYLKVF